MALADRAARAVGGLGVYALADDVAYDIPLPEGTKAGEADGVLRDLFSGAAVDVAVQRAESRRKKVLLADMDSTMIEQECIDELADVLGVGEAVAAITERAMRGELDFRQAQTERMALLAGKPADVVEQVLAERIVPRSGGRELVRTMAASGAHCALVSGGFTAFTEPLARHFGFHENRANVLDARDGLLTGRIVEPLLGREAKAQALAEIVAAKGLTPADVLAVGDGANDLAMLSAAGTGVALHAKPVVAEQADIRIDHGDLTALLYLQGYRKADFET